MPACLFLLGVADKACQEGFQTGTSKMGHFFSGFTPTSCEAACSNVTGCDFVTFEYDSKSGGQCYLRTTAAGIRGISVPPQFAESAGLDLESIPYTETRTFCEQEGI